MMIQAPRSDEEARYLSHRLSACKYGLEDAERRHDRARADQYKALVERLEIALGVHPTEEPEPDWLTKARNPQFLPSDHTQTRYQMRLLLVDRLNEAEAAYQQAIKNPLDNAGAARYLKQVRSFQAQLKEHLDNPWNFSHAGAQGWGHR